MTDFCGFEKKEMEDLCTKIARIIIEETGVDAAKDELHLMMSEATTIGQMYIAVGATLIREGTHVLGRAGHNQEMIKKSTSDLIETFLDIKKEAEAP